MTADLSGAIERKNLKQRLLASTLCLVAAAAFPYSPSGPRDSRPSLVRAGRDASPPPGVGRWVCWHDRTPVRSLPVPAAEKLVRVIPADKIMDGACVSYSPLGAEWLRFESRQPGDRVQWFWVPLAYCRRVAPENATGGDLPIGRERIGPYDGLPFDYRPSDLVAVPARYCYNDLPQRLRAEAAEACIDMLKAAGHDAGLRLKVLSTFRSARTQAYLCRRKIETEGIGQGEVARPGHSEHQLGTAVDLVRGDGQYLLEPEFGSTPEGRWLRANCRRFGFVMTYTAERAAREDTAVEPWHFRYVGRENVERFCDE